MSTRSRLSAVLSPVLIVVASFWNIEGQAAVAAARLAQLLLLQPLQNLQGVARPTLGTELPRRQRRHALDLRSRGSADHTVDRAGPRDYPNGRAGTAVISGVASDSDEGGWMRNRGGAR